MNLKSMDLVWIVVDDIKAAVKFYTETVGLKLMEFNEEYGWAELEGMGGGAKLGLAQKDPKCSKNLPGQNAVMTFTVASLEQAIADITAKGTKLEGEIQEVPGHVKLQMALDADGNRFQLVEILTHSCCHC